MSQTSDTNIFGPISVGVVGNACGKSRLIVRFVNNEYVDQDDPTVEDTYHKTFSVGGAECKLSILDTSGNDCYSNLYEKWFSSVESFIASYSISSAESFDAVQSFIEVIEKVRKSKAFPLVIVGTQLDNESVRQVTTKEGMSLAYRYKCPFIEVSAKTGANVTEAFELLAKEVRKFRQNPPDLSVKSQRKKKKKEEVAAVPIEHPDKVGTWKVNSKKKWVALKTGILFIYKTQKEFSDNKPSATVNMMTSTVKPHLGKKEKKPTFDLVTINKMYKVELDNQQEMTEWIEKLQEAILGQLNSVTSAKELNMSFERSPEDDWRIIQKSDESNMFCADCGASEPDWCSINLGILMCIQCSGVHRSLGTHITKVRSLTLDKLDEEIYQFLQTVGNARANKIWENTITKEYVKPQAKDERAKKEKFIRAKYDAKLFLGKKTSEDKSELGKLLYDSCSKGDLFSAIQFHAFGADVNYINASDGQTPLHKASSEGNILLVTWLIQANLVNSTILNANNQTALDVARLKKRAPVASYLQKKGALQNITDEKTIDSVPAEEEPQQEITPAEKFMTMRGVEIENKRKKLLERKKELEERKKRIEAERNKDKLSDSSEMYVSLPPISIPVTPSLPSQNSMIKSNTTQSTSALSPQQSRHNRQLSASAIESPPPSQDIDHPALNRKSSQTLTSKTGVIWTLTIISPTVTLKTKVDPGWTVSEAIKRLEKKFPDADNRETALFCETTLYYLQLDESVPLYKFEQVKDFSELILREKDFQGTRVKPVKKHTPISK